MLDLETYQIVNVLAVCIGLIFGMIAQKKQFCFSGSIKDYILTKSTKRASSVIMAMLVAIISSQSLFFYYDIDISQSIYYKENINYFAIIFGSCLFGAGMMIADGCGNRSLVKFAQGDSNALVTLLFIAIFAYGTSKGFLSGFLRPFTQNDYLIELSSYITNISLNIYALIFVLFVLLAFFVRKIKRIFSLADGFFIGLLIACAWALTGILGEESMERLIDLQAISFIYPSAQSLELFMFYQVNELQFSVALLLGVVLGSFLMSSVNKKYSFGCTSNVNINKVKYNMIGGALMGTGGILSIGCTVGQGLSGLSTLAFSSLLAIVCIFISGFITAKILNKYNKLPMCFIFEWNDTSNYQI
ncbi:MAG: YeeE/YedE family protein [Campylobacteraceae bacterium]|nr:YeeE/YedE family protein [Campylobacteraceae bacterium]